MENIGKSFKNINFNKTAEQMSFKLRMDKGMPLHKPDKMF
jgi:hypothetical protein